MPTSYQIDPERRWIEITLSGAITADETVALMKQMYADPAYSDDLSGVVDCRGMANVLNINDVRGVADMQLARPGPAWRSKRAVVVSSPEQYGTTRLFMIFAESGPVQYSVFYNMEAALQWLKE